MAEALTSPQLEVHNALFELEDEQRVFDLNNKMRLGVVRRNLIHEVTAAVGTGLVLGGLVGALIGSRRRR